MKVTRHYLELLGYSDTSSLRDTLRYEILNGIRVIFKACVGGWSEPELWVGGGIIEPILLKSTKQLQSLLTGLGIDRTIAEPETTVEECWCGNCKCDTMQQVYCAEHERDSSGDWQRCLVCRWRRSGLTGNFEPPTGIDDGTLPTS